MGLTARDLRIEEAVPWTKRYAARWIYVHGTLDSNRDDVESDCMFAMVILAGQWDTKRGVPWMAFLASRLKGRLVDELRKQTGRTDDPSFEARAQVRNATANDPRERWTAFVDPGFAEVDDRDAPDPVEQILAGLSSRKRKIVLARLEGQNMAQIGIAHGVSDSRVSQLLKEIRADVAELRVAAVAVAVIERST